MRKKSFLVLLLLLAALVTFAVVEVVQAEAGETMVAETVAAEWSRYPAPSMMIWRRHNLYPGFKYCSWISRGSP